MCAPRHHRRPHSLQHERPPRLGHRGRPTLTPPRRTAAEHPWGRPHPMCAKCALGLPPGKHRSALARPERSAGTRSRSTSTASRRTQGRPGTSCRSPSLRPNRRLARGKLSTPVQPAPRQPVGLGAAPLAERYLRGVTRARALSTACRSSTGSSTGGRSIDAVTSVIFQRTPTACSICSSRHGSPRPP